METTDLSEQKRAEISSGNLWKVINNGTAQKVTVKCIAGPDKVKVTRMSRIDFLERLVDPEEFK